RIQAIQSDSLMMVPEVEDEGQSASRPQDFGQTAEESLKIGDSHPKGPLGEATEVALADLAEFVLGGDLSPASAMVIQGIESQKIGEDAAATDAYSLAEQSGINSPSMYMCLGMVYVNQEMWPEAEKYLGRVKGE